MASVDEILKIVGKTPVVGRVKGKLETKQEFYELFFRGAFGNRPLTWNTLEEIRSSGWSGGVCIRVRSTSSAMSYYDVPLDKLDFFVGNLRKKGVLENQLTFNQSMPNNFLTIQGEVMQGSRGLDLHYTTIKQPMKLGLAVEQLNVSGVVATWLLRKNMDRQTYDEVGEFLKKYSESDVRPGPVVEFSSYSCSVGDCRGRNTIVWEVRNY